MTSCGPRSNWHRMHGYCRSFLDIFSHFRFISNHFWFISVHFWFTSPSFWFTFGHFRAPHVYIVYFLPYACYHKPYTCYHIPMPIYILPYVGNFWKFGMDCANFIFFHVKIKFGNTAYINTDGDTMVLTIIISTMPVSHLFYLIGIPDISLSKSVICESGLSYLKNCTNMSPRMLLLA